MTAIGEICEREVVYTTRDATVQVAAKMMRQYHVGTLVVVDAAGGRRAPVGILTDRDIVISVDALDLDTKTITVGDIMSPELVTIRAEDSALQAAEVMRFKGVRRLPVVDADGNLAGIVSIDDLLESLTEEMTEMARVLGREREHEVRSRR
jgi:CBS domain-containing protein